MMSLRGTLFAEDGYIDLENVIAYNGKTREAVFANGETLELPESLAEAVTAYCRRELARTR